MENPRSNKNNLTYIRKNINYEDFDPKYSKRNVK